MSGRANVRAVTLPLGLAAVMVLLSCASSRSWKWAEDCPAERAADDYAIAASDLLGVRVYGQEPLTTRSRVRSDGRISMPLIGDVMVRGMTPARVAAAIAARLREYVVSPMVTVTVEESAPSSISVLGEVARPGIYPLDSAAAVLPALAAAGGLTQFAGPSEIYVVRAEPPLRVRFSLAKLTEAGSPAATFRLRRGDVVVVE